VEGVTLSVQVLNECYWPIGAKEKFPVPGKPAEMVTCVTAFEKFFKSESAGSKKLNWMYGHGTISLSCKVGKTRCEVVVTPFQAAILCLFNSADKLTTTEIMSRLWPGEERKSKLRLSKSSSSLFDIDLLEILASAIQPLSSWDKFQVLQKEPVEPKDQIGENDSFTIKIVNHRKRKIAFPAGSAKAAIIDTNVDKKNVIAQRKFEIDAAMVRVMKARNVCTWNDMQVQVVELLKARFMPMTKMMKERLESLIERGFIERDTDDTSRLKYIA
jgi:cullin 1